MKLIEKLIWNRIEIYGLMSGIGTLLLILGLGALNMIIIIFGLGLLLPSIIMMLYETGYI